MAALTAARVEPRLERWGTRKFPLADNVKVFAGGLAAIDTSVGYVLAPQADATTYIAIGIFQEDVDNTIVGHTAGGLFANVELHREVKVRWMINGTGGDAVAATDLGKDCYIMTDNQVSISSNTSARSKAGRIWGVGTKDGQSCVAVEMFSGAL